MLDDGGMLGFGLLLSKQILERYGGHLEFASEYNVGSTFAYSFDIELRGEFETEKNKANINIITEKIE